MKLVSAIIITHNRLELVKRAIRSVQEQTYRNLELIVVDDASSDGTKEWCEVQNFRFICIPKEESRGGNHARNLGIEAAAGEYVAFLDDDDYWLPEKIERQVALIEEKNCKLVFCGERLEIVGRDGVTFGERRPSRSHCGDVSKKILMTVAATTSSNILADRKAVIEAGLFDENLRCWQDYEFTIRMAQVTPFYYVDDLLTVYRVDPGDKNRLTSKFFVWQEAVRYIRQKHAKLYAKLSLYQRLRAYWHVTNDASQRCKSAGLTGRYIYYSAVTFVLRLPFRVGKLLKERPHGRTGKKNSR